MVCVHSSQLSVFLVSTYLRSLWHSGRNFRLFFNSVYMNQSESAILIITLFIISAGATGFYLPCTDKDELDTLTASIVSANENEALTLFSFTTGNICFTLPYRKILWKLSYDIVIPVLSGPIMYSPSPRIYHNDGVAYNWIWWYREGGFNSKDPKNFTQLFAHVNTCQGMILKNLSTEK